MNNTIATLNNAEVVAHKLVDMIANFVKAIITLIIVVWKGAYNLGVIARNAYENTPSKQAITACKLLAAAHKQEQKVNVLESEDRVIVVPTKVETNIEINNGIEDYWNAQIEALNATIKEISVINAFEYQLCLPEGETHETTDETITIEKIEETGKFNGKDTRYEKTGRGRCRKGYRRDGNFCVLIEYIKHQEQVLKV